MPYIKLRTNKQIEEDKKEAIKAKLGEDIKLLGKSEDWLMVDLSTNEDMYFKGEKTDLAYIEVKLYGRSDASQIVITKSYSYFFMKKKEIEIKLLIYRVKG